VLWGSSVTWAKKKAGLLPLLRKKADRGFFIEAQQHVQRWNALLERVEATRRVPPPCANVA
jgi:hypothetical protein